MKRIFLFLNIVCLLVIPISAKNLLGAMVISGLDATTMDYEQNIMLNGEEITLYTSSISSLRRTFKEHDLLQLPYEERAALYVNLQQEITWPAFKNLLVGFGSGSKLQGDLSSELFGLIMDYSTAAVIGTGLGIMLLDLIFVYPFYGDTHYWYGASDPFVEISLNTMFYGGVAMVAGRLIQAILPVSYGLRYNRTLRNGLGVTKDVTKNLAVGLGVQPTVGGTAGTQFVASLSLALN